MINNYNSFILEKRVISLILESDLMASNDFIFKLSKIKDKSLIANILFNNFESGTYIKADLPQNYIDITDKDDTISFTSDIKASKFGFDTFKMKGRSEIKIGRFARSLLTNSKVVEYLDVEDDVEISKLSNKDYEDFVNLFKSTYQKQSYKFVLVSGEDIVKYYNEDNYSTSTGQLGSSCMRYGPNSNNDSCSDFFGIYTENECVRLLVYLDESGKVLGRSIIWKLSESPCDSKYFMDRIYTASDSDLIKFQNYADNEGWLRKYKNSPSDEESIMFIYKGRPILGRIKIELDESEFDYYPFMDTITYVNVSSKFASNIESKNMISCDDTNGSFEEECDECYGKGSYTGPCTSCNYGKSYCHTCTGSGNVRCVKCTGVGFDLSTVKECECRGKKYNCVKCRGKGQTGEPCDNCKNGFSVCIDCSGSGEQTCKVCNGTSKLTDVKCPECVGRYKVILGVILSTKNYSNYHKQAEEELIKLGESKEKKK